MRNLCVNIDWIPNVEFAGIFYAIKNGYYRDLGLDVRVVSRRTMRDDVADNVVSGRCDVGMHVGSTVLSKRLEGYDIKAFAATMQMTPVTVLSLAEKNIRTIKDLKNKRFGYYAKTDLDILFLLLRENGLSLSDVNASQIKIAYDDIINDKVDALFAYEMNQPVIFGLESRPVNLIYAYNNGFIFYGTVYFAKTDFIERNAKLLKDFLEATHKGWASAFENVDDTSDYIMKDYYPPEYYVKGSKELTLQQQRIQLRLLYRYMTSGVGLRRLGYMSKHVWQKGIDLYKRHGLLTKDVSVDDLMTMKVLEELYHENQE